MADEHMDARVARQVRHFDAIAERYREGRRTANHVLLKDLIWGDFLRGSPLASLAHARVLEAMCGYADGKAILERHLPGRIEYEGFDFSERVVAALRAERPDLCIQRADATTFSPPPERYDLVMALGGLHHVWHAAGSVIRSLAGGLKPGGYFMSLEPTHGNRIARRIRERIYARNPLFDAETERAFSVDELESLFADAGLRRARVMYPGLLAYVLYYNPDAFPRLNLGTARCVRAAYALDRVLLCTRAGRFLSFATLALWQKPGAASR